MPELAQLPELFRAAAAAFQDRQGPELSTALLENDTPALILLLALRKAYGPDAVNWEPESLWIRHDFSPSNRDKLSAAKTLATHPTLFTEPRGFAAISLALSGLVPDITELNPVPPEAMAWAALEGALIYALAHADGDEPDYGPDVTEFVAITLAHEGFVCAPELLDFSDDRLEQQLSADGRELRDAVKREWKTLDASALKEHVFPESAVGVQLARLAAVQLYCQELAGELLAALP